MLSTASVDSAYGTEAVKLEADEPSRMNDSANPVRLPGSQEQGLDHLLLHSPQTRQLPWLGFHACSPGVWADGPAGTYKSVTREILKVGRCDDGVVQTCGNVIITVWTLGLFLHPGRQGRARRAGSE